MIHWLNKPNILKSLVLTHCSWWRFAGCVANLQNKCLPIAFFTNVFIKVSTVTSQFVPTQLPWETLEFNVGVPLTTYRYMQAKFTNFHSASTHFGWSIFLKHLVNTDLSFLKKYNFKNVMSLYTVHSNKNPKRGSHPEGVKHQKSFSPSSIWWVMILNTLQAFVLHEKGIGLGLG